MQQAVLGQYFGRARVLPRVGQLLAALPLTPPASLPFAQPKEIKEIKEFLLAARRKDARSVKIMKTSGTTKFKVRCSRYLYTLRVTDADKAEKLRQSLPPGEQGSGGGGGLDGHGARPHGVRCMPSWRLRGGQLAVCAALGHGLLLGSVCVAAAAGCDALWQLLLGAMHARRLPSAHGNQRLAPRSSCAPRLRLQACRSRTFRACGAAAQLCNQDSPTARREQ